LAPAQHPGSLRHEHRHRHPHRPPHRRPHWRPLRRQHRRQHPHLLRIQHWHPRRYLHHSGRRWRGQGRRCASRPSLARAGTAMREPARLAAAAAGDPRAKSPEEFKPQGESLGTIPPPLLLHPASTHAVNFDVTRLPLPTFRGAGKAPERACCPVRLPSFPRHHGSRPALATEQ